MSNYFIDNGITISGASIGLDSKIVILTTSPHSIEINYSLSVSNVKDVAEPPNIITSDNIENLYI